MSNGHYTLPKMKIYSPLVKIVLIIKMDIQVPKLTAREFMGHGMNFTQENDWWLFHASSLREELPKENISRQTKRSWFLWDISCVILLSERNKIFISYIHYLSVHCSEVVGMDQEQSVNMKLEETSSIFQFISCF